MVGEDRERSWLDGIIVSACLEAERLGHKPVGSEHVLLALLERDAGSATGEPSANRLPVDRIRDETVRRANQERSVTPVTDPLSLRAHAALTAISLCSARIRDVDALASLAYLTLLSDGDAGAVRVLRAVGVRVPPLRLMLARRLGLIPVTPPPIALSPPGSLAAVGPSHEVRLRWGAVGDSDCTGYRLYRDGAVIHESPGTAFVDRPLRNGVTHVYAVAACDAWGRESERSAPVVATPIPDIGAFHATRQLADRASGESAVQGSDRRDARGPDRIAGAR